MGRSTVKRPTTMRFDPIATYIDTSENSIIKALARHPEARLVNVALNGNGKVARGEWELPVNCVKVVLGGGQAKVWFEVSAEAKLLVKVADEEGKGI